MRDKKCVFFGYRDGLWTVTFADKLCFEGDKRQALFVAAKLALVEDAGVSIEKDVPLNAQSLGTRLSSPPQPKLVQVESDVLQPMQSAV